MCNITIMWFNANGAVATLIYSVFCLSGTTITIVLVVPISMTTTCCVSMMTRISMSAGHVI